MEILKSKMVTKVSCGSELLAKLLARPDLRDVTVNLKDQNGWTPLMFAVQLNSTRFVRLMMMDNRVEANIRDNQGNSPVTTDGCCQVEPCSMCEGDLDRCTG